MERTGLGFVGAHDDLVEAALGDQFVGTPVTAFVEAHVSNFDLIEVRGGISYVADGEDFENVLGDEPRVPVDFHDADGVDLADPRPAFWATVSL